MKVDRDTAGRLMDAIIDKLRELPPEAVIRLLEASPEDRVLVEARLLIYRDGAPCVSLSLSLQHSDNAPERDGPGIPIEHLTQKQGAN